MKNRIVPFLLVFVSLCAQAPQADAAWIWTPQSRRWVNPKYAAKDTPSAQMEWAVGFFEKADYPRAAKEFRRLVRAYPRSEVAPEAQYLEGLSYELLDKPGEAVKAYKKVIEVYPFSIRFKDAIEREFSIAESFFSGKRLKLVGPVSFPSLDKAIEIYQHIVDQAPYGDFGSIAQYRLGECLRKQQRYEEASRAFQRVVDEYPSSQLVEQAKYNVAFCAYQLSLKPSYDQSATDEAITWYKTFLASHPESGLAAEAEASLRQLEEFKAQGLAKVADFYEKQGKGASAVMYYRQIVQEYPHTAEASRASGKISELEKAGPR